MKRKGRRLDWAEGGIRSQCRCDKISVSPTRGSWNKDEVKTILKRKNKLGELSLPDFKTDYEVK